MPVPAKLVTLHGLLGKEEAVYGTAIALTTTSDGLLMQFTDRNQGNLWPIAHAFDGDLGPSVASGATTKRAAPAGKSVGFSIPFRAKGAGAAYSATVVPNVHRILKASGFDGTGVTTVSSEKWTYAPTAEGTGYASLTLNGYSRGQLHVMTGAVGTLSVQMDNQAPPMWTWEGRAIAGAVTDVAVPSITYPSFSTVPPSASSAAVTIGSFITPVLLSATFTYNRGIDNPRVPISGTHLGFVPSGRGPRMSMTIESTAVVADPFHTSAGLDPYALRDAGTSIVVAITVGTTQYNKYTIQLPYAQLVNVTDGNNGPVATWTLEFAGHGSTPVLNDDVSILFD